MIPPALTCCQVFFNEAIRAAVEEKDKKICSLEAQLVTGSQAELEVRVKELGVPGLVIVMRML